MKQIFVLIILLLNLSVIAQDQATEVDIGPTKLEKALLEVFSASGLDKQYEELFRYLIEKKQHFFYFPKGLFSIEDIKLKILNYVGKSLTPDEIYQLKKEYQNIFLSKISKLTTAPVLERDNYTSYIRKYGKKANAEKVKLLSEVSNILNTDPFLLAPKLIVEKAIEVQNLRRREEYSNNSIAELSSMSEKTAETTFQNLRLEQPLFQARSMFYKHRFTTVSELKEFIRLYKDNELIKKLFKLQLEAMASYSKLAFEALTDDKKLSQKK